MCGRYQITSPLEAITNLIGEFQTLDYQQAPDVPIAMANSSDPVWPQVYNAAPTMMLPVITLTANLGLALQPMHWGLIPKWAKDKSFAAKTINARLETAHEKPSFRKAMRSGHAIVPITAYFEWQQHGDAKQPYRFHHVDETPLLLAGLWSEWNGLKTFSLLTAESVAYPTIHQIHHRMPLALTIESARDWLDDRLKLLPETHEGAEFLNHCIRNHPISRDINKVANQSADLVKPIQLAASNPDLASSSANQTSSLRPSSSNRQGDLFS